MILDKDITVLLIQESILVQLLKKDHMESLGWGLIRKTTFALQASLTP